MERALITSQGGKFVLNLYSTSKNITRRKTESNEKPLDDEMTILTEEEMRMRDRANILRALTHCDGKITGSGGAAEILKIKPSTLNSRIKNWDLRGKSNRN